MILLDTNVIFEAMKAEADSNVRTWLDQQAAEALFISSVTLAELLFGIGALPDGRRKIALAETLDGLLSLFGDRVLAFDAEATRHYAGIAVAVRAVGRGFPTPDGYIAAIAAAHGFSLATRDVAPFQAAGLKVINPWHGG